MSIFGSDDLARTRNVLYTDPNTVPTTTGTGTGEQGPQGPQGATGPTGPTGATGPQGPKGENAYTIALKATGVNLLGPVVTSSGGNTTLFTYMDGSAFTVPSGQIAIVKTCYMKVTAVTLTGTYSGSGWSAPIFRVYKGGTNEQVANTLTFATANYLSTDHFGFNSTPAGGRQTALAGESISIGASQQYSPASGFTYTTLTVNAFIECLIVNA